MPSSNDERYRGVLTPRPSADKRGQQKGSTHSGSFDGQINQCYAMRDNPPLLVLISVLWERAALLRGARWRWAGVGVNPVV